MEAGQLLLKSGLLNNAQLMSVRESNGNGNNVVDRAVEMGFVREDEALKTIGQEVGLDFVDIAQEVVDLELLEQFPQKLIYRQNLFPIKRDNGSVVVATADPFDLYPLDEAGEQMGAHIHPVLAEKREIAKLIKEHLGVGGETIEGLIEQRTDDGVELLEDIETDGSELSEMAQEASVVRLVNEILLEAIESKASDVHIESQGSGIAIRYRIDGILHPQPVPPEINQFQAAIISRLKIMSRLNIAEKRLPQDGRIKLRVKGREIDVRLSVIPMIHGEGLVMRILDKGSMTFDLRKLGMAQRTYDIFKELIRLPYGIILVTGPTGSGKTTTLYSSLLEINSPDTKIITTEDPVEYQLDGINQIQVHPKIGLTFAASLRSILRHDPDVVLVGEIRDFETAENAIQASLTGHLVFSTLHTNDAASAYTRMVDMGVESYLVASTVEAVMAQRLVRRLCPSCKKEFNPNKREMPSDFPWDEYKGEPLFDPNPDGCRECRGVGYSGRMGVYELLVTTDDIRELATERRSAWDLKQVAVKGGMKSLRDDAWLKAIAGNTSMQEVTRLTKSDSSVGM
ncbi:MAG: ATPase, T2SS/T4P/T4SS family [Planctomycetota bacterium]|nr:ATPase, T2SS/T4P/T4SS family [Planctomycetota bacterium]